MKTSERLGEALFQPLLCTVAVRGQGKKQLALLGPVTAVLLRGQCLCCWWHSWEPRLAQLAGWCPKLEACCCSCLVTLLARWTNSLWMIMFQISLDYLQAAWQGKNCYCCLGLDVEEDILGQIWLGLCRKPRNQFWVLRKLLFQDNLTMLVTVNWIVLWTPCPLVFKTSMWQWPLEDEIYSLFLSSFQHMVLWKCIENWKERGF